MQNEWLGLLLLVLSIAGTCAGMALAFKTWLRSTAVTQVAGMALLLLSLLLWLFALNLFRYDSLYNNEVIATVAFEQQSPGIYRVSVIGRNDRRLQYEMQGDVWRMDVRVLVWRGLQSIGLKPMHKLDRIEAAFTSLENARARPPARFALLQSDILFNLWELASRVPLPVRAEMRSVAGVPVVNGAQYIVSGAANGEIQVQAVNASARLALRRMGR